MSLEIVWLGRVAYAEAWQRQRELHERVAAGTAAPTVLLLEHDSVYTAGRRTTDDERPTNGTPVVDVARGGKITWHGPGQLVGYPIVPLAATVGSSVDVVAYVRELEGLLIDVCADLGVATHRVGGRSGVWAGAPPLEAKVAAIGVRVSRGVTMHGFAVNADCDLSAFGAIVPCGIRDASVTSLTRLAGRGVTVDEVRALVTARLEAQGLAGAPVRPAVSA